MIDETILRNVLKEIKEFPEGRDTLIDSFSDNQFLAKKQMLEKLDFLTKESEVVIFGSWYGSILIPYLSPIVKRITCIDLDNEVLQVSKNRLFKHLKNVEYNSGDVFKLDLSRYHTTDLFINPSCEHMPPMKEFPYWPKSTHFAFTSNNMYDIEGHVNCVSSIQEFKNQLPDNATVTVEHEIKDSRGIRYLIVGKLC
jgi:hypothetical protein